MITCGKIGVANTCIRQEIIEVTTLQEKREKLLELLRADLDQDAGVFKGNNGFRLLQNRGRCSWRFVVKVKSRQPRFMEIENRICLPKQLMILNMDANP
ncbi:unnamed protein product [Cylicocyclus nassatus]|uniref:Uncharacterized protein n=1 Tax=Cylicocyclus nassatus TaxID=53992 RepID=A0AA36GUP8_CYLNA|nr:unnamed protein product [Cylicocyclus nassatus]